MPVTGPATNHAAADRCPGVLRLAEAADGYLARIRLPGGLIGAEQMRVLARLAGELGDGRVELTSRGNVQLRGLRRTQADTEFLARELAAVRLALADVVTTQDLEDSLSRLAELITDQPLPTAPGLRTTPDGQSAGASGTGLPITAAALSPEAAQDGRLGHAPRRSDPSHRGRE